MKASGFDITVVVCTYNRAELLRNALKSLVLQETDGRFRYEILVVNNASMDETDDVIDAIAATANVPVRRVLEPRPGVSFARNRGLVESVGTWIAFFDDDQLADRRWLVELMSIVESTNSLCAGGPVFPSLPQDCPPELKDAYRQILEQSSHPAECCRYEGRMTPGTGSLLVHRSLFDRIGVFDESLQEGGEDTDWYQRVRRAGMPAWYTPKAIAHHVVSSSRLAPEVLHWAYRRTGWVFARRDRKDYGRVGQLVLLVARIVQAIFLRWPRLVWNRLRGNHGEELVLRCRLALTEGYLRGTLHSLAPHVFAQRDFIAALDFRDQRALMGG